MMSSFVKTYEESEDETDVTNVNAVDSGRQDYSKIIFPLCSVNLISAPSNSGKSFFIQNLLLNCKIFFKPFPQRIVYVSGPRQAATNQHLFSNLANLPPITHLGIEEFIDLDSLLKPNDILILDDLLHITEEVDYCVKILCHHLGIWCFLITQTCLGDKLYALLSRSHNLVINFKNTASVRLVQHLLHTFFFGNDTKVYLKEIIGRAAHDKTTCVLKLNSIASNPKHAECLVFEGVERLFKNTLSFDRHSRPQSTLVNYCRLYPELGDIDLLREDYFKGMNQPVDNRCFYLVPADRFIELQSIEKASLGTQEDHLTCANKKLEWDKIVDLIKQEIENYFPFKQWLKAKSLAREILRNKHLCVSSDARTLMIKKRPSKNVGLLDFLQVTLRRSAPNEDVLKFTRFVPFVDLLLKNKMPHSFIVNKALLNM